MLALTRVTRTAPTWWAPSGAMPMSSGSTSARCPAACRRAVRRREAGTAVREYAHGVMDELAGRASCRRTGRCRIPTTTSRRCSEPCPAALGAAGIDPAEVIGIGMDFTACTVLPVLADGTPLCVLPRLAGRPHASAKLWKHHAAQPQADRINGVGARARRDWLAATAGKISSEWVFPKALADARRGPRGVRAR